MNNTKGDIESPNTQILTVKTTRPPIQAKKRRQKTLKCILGIVIAAILLGIAAIAISVVLLNNKATPSTNPHDDVQEEISKTLKLKLRLPRGNFEECCLTEEKKKNFLSNCNAVFNRENIDCVDTSKGSIVMHLEGKVDDILKRAISAISKVDSIGGQRVDGFHVYDPQNPTNPGSDNDTGSNGATESNNDHESDNDTESARDRIEARDTIEREENERRETERREAERRATERREEYERREAERREAQRREAERRETERREAERRAAEGREAERRETERREAERRATERREPESRDISENEIDKFIRIYGRIVMEGFGSDFPELEYLRGLSDNDIKQINSDRTEFDMKTSNEELEKKFEEKKQQRQQIEEIQVQLKIIIAHDEKLMEQLTNVFPRIPDIIEIIKLPSYVSDARKVEKIADLFQSNNINPENIKKLNDTLQNMIEETKEQREQFQEMRSQCFTLNARLKNIIEYDQNLLQSLTEIESVQNIIEIIKSHDDETEKVDKIAHLLQDNMNLDAFKDFNDKIEKLDEERTKQIMKNTLEFQEQCKILKTHCETINAYDGNLMSLDTLFPENSNIPFEIRWIFRHSAEEERLRKIRDMLQEENVSGTDIKTLISKLEKLIQEKRNEQINESTIFQIGQRVKCRDNSTDDWRVGKIQKLNPLEVKIRDSVFRWNYIEDDGNFQDQCQELQRNAETICGIDKTKLQNNVLLHEIADITDIKIFEVLDNTEPRWYGRSDNEAIRAAGIQALFKSRDPVDVENVNEKLSSIATELKEQLDQENENNNGQELNECPICRVEMNENESYKTPCCGNCIHEHCIDHWTGLGNTECPLCRGNL